MKKQIIKVVLTKDDKIKRAKKFSRESFGQLPATKVVLAKKGGTYTRKVKHRQADDD